MPGQLVVHDSKCLLKHSTLAVHDSKCQVIRARNVYLGSNDITFSNEKGNKYKVDYKCIYTSFMPNATDYSFVSRFLLWK